MYDIILFTDVTDNIASTLPIGAYKCAHVLRRQGYSCLVVSHLSHWTQLEFSQLVDGAVSDQTKLIGFSTTFMRSVDITRDPSKPTPPYPDLPVNGLFPQGVEFENWAIARIKQQAPQVKIVVGGHKVNANSNNPNLDYVCLGYSEASIVNLADHIFSATALTATRNIFGVTIIDDRFAKTYDFANEDMRWLPEDVVNHKVLTIELARGCIFKCKFCSYPMNGKETLDFVKSEQHLLRELERNKEEFDIDHYIIIDDTFNDNVTKLERIRQVVDRLSFQPKFWAYSRLDLIATRPETIPVLYDIGVRAMFFGIESLNPKTAKIIGKGYAADKQIACIEQLRARYSDISLHGSFIVGLPQESEQSVTKTFNRLMNQEIPLHSWQFNHMHIFRKEFAAYPSDIDRNYTQYGYTDSDLDIDAGFISRSRLVNWKNQHMDFARSQELSSYFLKESRDCAHHKVQGQLAMSLTTLDDAEYVFERLIELPWKSLNFNHIETKLVPEFVQQYKRQLLKIISSSIA